MSPYFLKAVADQHRKDLEAMASARRRCHPARPPAQAEGPLRGVVSWAHRVLPAVLGFDGAAWAWIPGDADDPFCSSDPSGMSPWFDVF